MADKLQKILANAGLGSRRGVEKWIQEGRVSVNGLAAKIGDRAENTDRIAVDGKPIKIVVQQLRHLLYNKPSNEICSRNDPEGRKSVFKSLPRVEKQRWISVGRLDYSTTGLLLFTTDGELANKLMHPSFQIEREYAVRVLGHVSEEKLNAMREGVLLEDGVAKFTDIQKGQEEDESANQWYHVVIMEGRNREVRRLWESQDLTVSRLKRTRYGSFFIPSAVKAGKSIELKGKDVAALYLMAGVETKTKHDARSDEESVRPAKRQSNWGKSKRRSPPRETLSEGRSNSGSVKWKKPKDKGTPRQGTKR